MTTSQQSINAVRKLASTTLRKVTRRLIPFLFLLYIIAWLDRANVGFAAIHMNADLGLSSGAFGLGSGIFFIGYLLFEIPSNLILHRVGARLWIARIMVTWGLVSMAMMFVRTPLSFYVLRFLLGVAEAGFFPGVIYYLSLWYPSAHRAKAISGFVAAIPFAGLIGAPISGAILGLGGNLGLAGWQWLFLLEGLPAVAVGFLVPFCLTDRPEGASWLREPEREWLITTLESERQACVGGSQVSLLAALTDRTVLSLGVMAVLASMGFYGYTFWSPLIVKGFTGASDVNVGLIIAAMNIVAIVGMFYNSARADRTGELALHAAAAQLVMATGLIGCAFLDSPVAAMLSLALIPIGFSSAHGAVWSIPSRLLTGRAAAGGIAMVNSFGAIGAFLGPSLLGYLKDRTGTHSLAFLLLGGLTILGAMILLSLRSATGAAKGPAHSLS